MYILVGHCFPWGLIRCNYPFRCFAIFIRSIGATLLAQKQCLWLFFGRVCGHIDMVFIHLRVNIESADMRDLTRGFGSQVLGGHYFSGEQNAVVIYWVSVI